MTHAGKLKFLADESCDFGVVRALRKAGYDVLSVSEKSPGVEDFTVIELARREKRILLTEDSDFGQLVFAHGLKASGVIFMRYPAVARVQQAQDIVALIKSHGNKITGCFVVAQPGRIRISTTPRS